MICHSDLVMRPRRVAVILCCIISALVLAVPTLAADFDFNVANGNYHVAGSWFIHGDPGDPDAVPPVPPTPPEQPVAPPTIADRALIRNNGTVNITSDVSVLQMRIGYIRVVTAPDYNGDAFVDAADYVLWRKGGPLQNDSTPTDVGPDDYTLWRAMYGAASGEQNIGQSGTVMWTAGEITGQGPIDGDPYSGGPDIRVGRVETVNGVVQNVTGTVVQNGPTTKLLMPYRQSQLTIGDGTNSTNTPASSYTLMDGTIGTAIGSDWYQNDGTNNNNGIHVRNGSFTMTGGNIIDVTPVEYLQGPLNAQRFLTIATATGSGVGNETVATATLSGGNINVLGGIRMASSSHTRGYLNINGPVTIVTGGDTSIGYQPRDGGTNAIAEMNMSDGSFQVGRTDINPVLGEAYDLDGRLHVGDRGMGILNMSGGSIHVTNEVVVANKHSAAGSVINMTGGTITTGGLKMRRDDDVNYLAPPGDLVTSFIVNGPTASFTTSDDVIIGGEGKALFEVRQGNALLGGGGNGIEVSDTAASHATINVMGGKLTLAGPLTRSNTSSAAPVIGLTGGTLEFNNQNNGGASHAFQADLINTGTHLVTKPDALLQVNVGSASPAVPANFAMSSGSWDIDIGLHNIAGADWFNVPNGMASLTGGTLNINYLPGFTPNPNEVFTIIKGTGGVTLNSGAVTITGDGSPNWVLQTAGGIDIQLKYVGAAAGAGGGAVPEPATMVMFGICALVTLASRRARRTEL